MPGVPTEPREHGQETGSSNPVSPKLIKSVHPPEPLRYSSVDHSVIMTGFP